jgi:cytochrome c oxidase cbb3-type subunit 3
MGQFDGMQKGEEGGKMPLSMTVLIISLIVVGPAYLYGFSPVTTGWDQGDQYQRSRQAKSTSIISHEKKGEALGTVEMEEREGMAIYQANCAICHGEQLEGGIGPVLTGPNFLYGNSLADHIRIIADGTTNGMPGFKKQLSPERIHAVAHYLQTYRAR